MKKSLITLVLILTLQTVLLLNPLYVNASTTAIELVNPSDGSHLFSYTTRQKSVGDTFTINVTVKDVTDLFSWQIGVRWNASLLNYSSISLPANHIFAGKSYLPAGPDFPEPGYLVYGVSLGPGQKSFTGSGTLCQITFKIIKAPLPGQTLSCSISFEKIGEDTFLLNSMGLDISFTTVNAQYNYSQPWTPPPPAKVYLSPEKIVNASLTPGNTFNVSLNILNATDLHSWSVEIVFNQSVLSASNAVEGDFLKSAGSTNFNFQQATLNATHNTLYMNCSLTTATGKSGNGNLAVITFQVKSLGTTSLSFKDVKLFNPTGMPLPFTSKNGFFSNMLIAKLSIEPREVRGPEYIPGSTFTVNVTLSDVDSLKTCVFNLTYNPSVIQEININVLPIMGQSPIKKLVIDDAKGYIWANLTYKNGITVYGSVAMMSVEFQVLAAGVSPINLTETALYNLSGQSIMHDVYNGAFIGLIRDIAVTNVESDLLIAYQGWQVNINVTVLNKGNVTETFDVILYANGSQIVKGTVVELNPNEERTILMIWDTTKAQPCNFYKISAQAGPVQYEINTADNFLEDGSIKVRIMGDVNGDGKVDMRDVSASVLAFRAYPGRPTWNPEIDLDRNKIIDMRDIVIIILNLNKTC